EQERIRRARPVRCGGQRQDIRAGRDVLSQVPDLLLAAQQGTIELSLRYRLAFELLQMLIGFTGCARLLRRVESLPHEGLYGCAGSFNLDLHVCNATVEPSQFAAGICALLFTLTIDVQLGD